MKLQFWGAARQVTGSMYLLEKNDGTKILIDCGLDLEKRRERKEKKPAYQSAFPFEASSIHAVILTHAHLDHSGNIPNLFREGFEGTVICTPPTLALAQILLNDSAALNKRRLLGEMRGKRKRGRSPKQLDSTLYVESDVHASLKYFITIGFQQRVKVADGIYLTLYCAGHLLGAAHVFLEVENDGINTRIGFSGDLGRAGYPLLNDPEKLPEVDYLVCESTYGDRDHDFKGTHAEVLREIIVGTCVERPGRLIIPSFSVGRTQTLLYTLSKLCSEGKLPPIKVFSDSPMGYESTQAYQKYSAWLNKEAQEFKEEDGDLFDFENFHFVKNLGESKEVSNYSEPCILISSSGMMSGGRIEYHAKTNIENPYSTFYFIGFCAEGTLGHELINGRKKINLGGKEREVLARIERTDIFSGHADQAGLLNFVEQQDKSKLRRIFLVHGEEPKMLAFKGKLNERGYKNVETPYFGDAFDL